MKYLLAGIIGLFALASINAARAADMPVKAPPAPAAVSDPWYAFVDGSYNWIPLPSYSLGFHNAAAVAPHFDNGPDTTFDPQADGAGGRGGIGYRVPGTSWRFEINGSYVKADDGQTQVTTPSGFFVDPVMLTGNPFAAIDCTTPAVETCTQTSHLTTSYSSWQLNAKAAYDTRWGAAAISPFVALVGGSSRNNQTLTQSVLDTAVVGTLNYSATSSLTWNDFGARIGVDGAVPLSSALVWNVMGSFVVADRRVSLTASDSFVDVPFPGLSGATAISTSSTTADYAFNGETGFAVTVTPAITLAAFGGLNFDGRVPGISAPHYVGAQAIPVAPGPVPAGINYSQEVSYYTGGSLRLKF
jgi:hypothetical protein